MVARGKNARRFPSVLHNYSHGAVAYYANRREASSSKGSRKVAGRVFRSSAIVRRHDHFRIMSEDGYLIRIGCLLNIPKTRNNGFSEEVIAMIGLQGLEFWKVHCY